MREMNRYIKDQNRARNYSGNYNRPKFFLHNGVNYPVPPDLHSDKPFHVLPPLGFEPNPVTRKYLADPRRNSEGLAKDYDKRLFEYDRSMWSRQGFISPYENVRGRTTRDDLEFALWHHWHPNQEGIEERMDLESNEGYYRSFPYIDNNARLRGRPPGGTKHAYHRNHQDLYQSRRRADGYNRPRYRQRGSVDIRDPKNRPPYPRHEINSVQTGAHGLPSTIYQPIGRRHSQRYPTGIRLPNPRDVNHLQHPLHEIRGYGEPPQRPDHPVMDHHGRRPRGQNPFIYDGYDIQDDTRPVFLPPPPRIHPYHHLNDDDEDEDEDEEDIRSQHSTGSYTRGRPPPHIVWPGLPPYHGRPLGHSRRTGRHEYDINDEEDDELFRRSGGYMRRRRGRYGIGREGGRVRVGLRGYDGEGLDYGFSGDEDDFYDV